MRTIHESPEDPGLSTIRIEGLQSRLVLAHLTDVHLSAADARDPTAIDEADRLERTYMQYAHGGSSTLDILSRLIARSDAIGASCIALTGDILNLPTRAAIDRLHAALAGREYLYTTGNHDWHFPFEPPNDDTRRRYSPRFHSLTQGNPAFGLRVLNGVRLITLENSLYQIDEAQLSFLREQLATGAPCLLFMHIPLYAPSLIPGVMRQWQAPIVMGAEAEWTPETRARWGVGATAPATRACLELARTATNLAGIFCGHVHTAHADRISGSCVQYVTEMGLASGFREIRLEPLS